MNIRKRLESLAEPDFQKFSSKLIPNIPSETILGVRIPKLRELAKEIVKEDWRVYLAEAKENSLEETILQGMVIGHAKAEFEEILKYVKDFIPKIDNWSVCDNFCSGLKITKKYPSEMWEFIQPYFYKTRAYDVRFAVVMLLCYYVEKKYLKEAFSIFDQIAHEDYYVKMAVAWAISIYYVKFPEETMKYLKQNHLDDFTYHKALQKITESLRVDQQTKQKIRAMKRKR